MKHRHLNHEGWTLAAIEDVLARGDLPDWASLVRAIQADPIGEVADKTLRICASCDIYGASKLFRRLIENTRKHGTQGRMEDLVKYAGTCEAMVSSEELQGQRRKA